MKCWGGLSFIWARLNFIDTNVQRSYLPAVWFQELRFCSAYLSGIPESLMLSWCVSSAPHATSLCENKPPSQETSLTLRLPVLERRLFPLALCTLGLGSPSPSHKGSHRSSSSTGAPWSSVLYSSRKESPWIGAYRETPALSLVTNIQICILVWNQLGNCYNMGRP